MALVKYNNNSISAVTTTGLTSGDMVLIKEQTFSDVANVGFVHGTSSVVFDNTYKTYIFSLLNLHPETNSVYPQFNFSTDSGSNYNVTKTSTSFFSYQGEAGDGHSVQYDSGTDLAQSTSYQRLTSSSTVGNENDESMSGLLHVFDPSSTTFVKHFIARTMNPHHVETEVDSYFAGYGNTSSAINAINFQMSSGNMTGTIKMYGLNQS